MATIGKLAVQITAETAGLADGLRSADGQITSFSDKADFLVGKLKLLGPAAILAGGAFAGALIKSVADTADELGKLSQKTGVAVEDLSRLQYAAGLSGLSTDQLGGALSKLSRNMAEAATGGGEAAGAFDAMGISVKNADGTLKSQLDVLKEVADKFASYEDGAEKSALAMRIFGRAGADLIPLLNGGAQGLKNMADESDRLGNTLNDKTAKAAEQFNDNLTRLETAIGGVGRSIVSDLLPWLTQLTEEFKIGIEVAGGFSKALLTFGTINPFKDLKGNLKSIGEEIDELAAARERYVKSGSDTSGIDQALNTLKLRLEYLKRIRLQEIENQQGAADNQSAAESKRLGFVASTVAGAAPQVAAPKVDKASEGAKKAADEVKKRAAEIEAFFGEVDATDRQRQIDKLNLFLETLKERQKAEMEAAAGGRASAEEKYALEQEQLLASLEAGLITKTEYDELTLQARMERDWKLMEMDQALLDNEKRIADERVAINQQAEQMILSAKMAAATEAVNLLSALGGKSKAAAIAAIALNKALSIAGIIQNTAVAQMRALAELGPIAGPPAAASIGTYGKIQAGLVAATGLVQAGNVGGGGSLSLTPSSAGGGAGAGVNTPVGGTQTISIQGISSGDLFSGDSVRVLIDRLIEAQRNGARIVLA